MRSVESKSIVPGRRGRLPTSFEVRAICNMKQPLLRSAPVVMHQLLILAAVSLSAMAIASLAGCDSRGPQSGNSFRPSSAPLASRAPAPAIAPKTDKPRVVSWPDLERYYPEDAFRDHINGIVRITVTLDKAGRATDTIYCPRRRRTLVLEQRRLRSHT